MMYVPHKGFTLIETMVAITLLAVALIGPYVAVQNALQGSYVARDQLVASNLAQEAIEYVRFVRDNNYLASRSWMDGLSSLGCYGANPDEYCTVDPTRGDVHSSSDAIAEYSDFPSSVPALYLGASGLYNQQTSGTPTRFKRAVQITTVSPTEVAVVVQVYWITSNKPYTLTVTENLQDWI